MTVLTDELVLSSFGQIEQGVPYIRKSMISSTKKVFLECTVVELVYKYNNKSYHECLKRCRR